MNQAQMIRNMRAEYIEWMTDMELWRVETDVVSYVEACGVADALQAVHGWQEASEVHARRAVVSDVDEMLTLDGWTLGDWRGSVTMPDFIHYDGMDCYAVDHNGQRYYVSEETVLDSSGHEIGWISSRGNLTVVVATYPDGTEITRERINGAQLETDNDVIDAILALRRFAN